MPADRYDLDKFSRKLKKYLDDDRFRHSQGVRYTAAAMAMAHGLDHHRAETAGLLHDAAKNIPDKKQILLCEKNGIPVAEIERKNPYLLHAKLGAWLAEEKYHVTDSEILSAIKWHTTGTEDMTPLEQIIFIADYIEPGRFKAANLPEIRKLAFSDLNECCYAILRDTIAYLDAKCQKNGRPREEQVDEHTQMAFNYYRGLHLKRTSSGT